MSNDLSAVFGAAPQRGQEAVTTAYAIRLFHDELVARGFTPEFAEQAALAAVPATVSRYDLTVAPTQNT